jgi:hypothetical protein
VTSNPSPAYVARVAAAFGDNGEGVRGDLKAVWTAVLTDPEALAPSDAAIGGKLREPVARYAGWARTVGVASENGKWEIFDLSNAGRLLGQSPLRSPSVFNFFRPGYVPPHTAIAEAGAVAPEFQIANETSIAGYANFLQWAIRGGNGDVKPTYAAMLAFAHDPHEVVRWLNLHLAAGQLSSASCALIEGAVASVGATAESDVETKTNALASACLLVMCAPEYLVQK